MKFQVSNLNESPEGKIDLDAHIQHRDAVFTPIDQDYDWFCPMVSSFVFWSDVNNFYCVQFLEG